MYLHWLIAIERYDSVYHDNLINLIDESLQRARGQIIYVFSPDTVLTIKVTQLLLMNEVRLVKR